MEIYIVLCIIALFAGFIQGLSGFGSGLLALPFLILFLGVKMAIPLVALYGVALTLLLIVQLRQFWDWKKIYPLCAGSVPGVPVGVWLLNVLDAQIIQWIVGLVLILYALYSLLKRPAVMELSNGWAYLSGFLAGCLGGSISASGPPVIVYTSFQPWSTSDKGHSPRILYYIRVASNNFPSNWGLMTESVFFLLRFSPISAFWNLDRRTSLWEN